MEEVYRSKYSVILYDSNQFFLEYILFETTENMTEKDLKNDLRVYSQYTLPY